MGKHTFFFFFFIFSFITITYIYFGLQFPLKNNKLVTNGNYNAPEGVDRGNASKMDPTPSLSSSVYSTIKQKWRLSNEIELNKLTFHSENTSKDKIILPTPF